MQSRTSYFNGTLFRKNLTRSWPLWGMASFLGALFPLSLLLELIRNPPRDVNPLNFTEAYYSILSYGVPVISLLYAILCAMMVWSYLYNARSVGMMHALPIRREGLFLTNFLSGMAMMLIPYAVAGSLCVLISLACGGLDMEGVLVTVLGVLGESFFYFAGATFTAFVTGSLFALPALYFLFHFLAVLLDWLLSIFAEGFLLGLSGGYSGAAEWLSPTVYLLRHAGVDRTYAETDLTGSRWTQSVLTAVELENAWLIGAYALAGAALLALAYALYRRRRSESAGDVVAVGWMKPLFRFGLAALAALLGGLLLYALFWEQFQSGSYCDALPMAVCMAVAGIIGYYAASMLLAKSLRVFRKSWRGAALVAVGCAAVCAGLRFDLLGIESRVPETGSIQEVRMYTEGNHYDLCPGRDDDLIEEVLALHRAIAGSAEDLRDLDRETEEARSRDELYTYVWLELEYQLSSGRTLNRSYSLPLAKSRIDQDGTYDCLLDRLVNSEAMRAKRLHAGDDRYKVEGGSLYLEADHKYFDLSSREAAGLLDALGKDAAAGTWGTYDWFDSDDGSAYAMDLELSFSYEAERGAATDWITITVRPGMENTLACLKELGLVTDADLVTYAELYPETYGYETEYGAGAEYSYEDPAASIGVIGGADGPTEVFAAGFVTGAAA